MKHIKQNKNECILATISALTNTPYGEIRARANRIARRIGLDSYQALFDSGRTEADWHPVIETLGKQYRFNYVPLLTPRRNKEWSLVHLTPTKLKRKGFILLRFPNSRHIVAFENGLVYDGNADGPLTPKQYKEFLRVRWNCSPNDVQACVRSQYQLT